MKLRQSTRIEQYHQVAAAVTTEIKIANPGAGSVVKFIMRNHLFLLKT